MTETKVKKFDSVEQFLADPKLTNVRHYDNDWCNGHSFNKTIKLAHNGDDSAVQDAEKLLDLIESTSEGQDIRQYQSSPNGAFVVVPEYLAGFPMPMRVMEATGEKSPIRIAVCITCSGGLSCESMRQRGVAILALVMHLQRIRPVELLLVNTLDTGYYRGNSFLAIQVESKPVSLSHASFFLADVGFARHLCYNWAVVNHGSDGHWPADYGTSNYEQVIKKALDLTENDLYIKDAHVHDAMLIDPVKWINAQVSRFNRSYEEVS